MQRQTNTPYVKDIQIVDGVPTVMNPIEGKYTNNGTNRRNRKPNKSRHRSNKKGDSIIILKDVVPTVDDKGIPDGGVTLMISKYKRTLQYINKKIFVPTKNEGLTRMRRTGKVIEHLVLIK